MQQRAGLTEQQVQASLAQHGANSLPTAKPANKLRIFLSQFFNPLVVILLVAAALTFFLAEYIDTAAILAVILINALFGFSQESRAQNALNALKQMIKPQVRVLRGNEEIQLTADSLVVGDLVKLKLGERIPADGILLEGSDLTVSEAVLTGESAPLEKTVGGDNKLFMGTVVLSGYGLVQITAVGVGTEFGKIAASLAEQGESQTPLQKRLAKFSRQLGVAVALLAALVFVIGLLSPNSTSSLHPTAGEGVKLIDLLTLCISLAVSAIPEGLVIGLVVVLTLSMQRLVRRKALVRKLAVAETLGSVTTICVDKTGTLTEGEMRVVAADLLDEATAKVALAAVNKDLNAVDAAISKWLAGATPKAVLDGDSKQGSQPGKHLFDIPFNSKAKFAASVFADVLYVVGAPEVLLAASDLTESEHKEWQHKIHAAAEHGLRIIAIAQRQKHNLQKADASKVLSKLDWLGTVSIEDPVRTDVKDAFKLLTEAGIKLKVITGDQKATALSVMEHAGIPLESGEALSGQELNELSDAQLNVALPNVKLFYRTVPEQKLRIVELLKQQGEVVAMLGDGVNDAPALKKADVGVAVANATEVSKETADIVLLDNNMFTIAAAVEEGRAIFENLKKVITYLLTDSTAEVILIIGSLLLGLPLPLIPLQILFINLIADGLPDIALAFEKPEQDLMRQNPIAPDAQLIDKRMIILIGVIGGVVNVFLFGMYFLLVQTGKEIAHIRSYIFLLLAVNSLLYVFSIRSLRHSIWEVNPFENRVLNSAVILGFIFVGLSFNVPFIANALELTPLNTTEVASALLLGLLNIFIIELIKYGFIVRWRQ